MEELAVAQCEWLTDTISEVSPEAEPQIEPTARLLAPDPDA